MWKESKSLANVQERLYKVSVMGFGEREKKKNICWGYSPPDYVFSQSNTWFVSWQTAIF